MDTAPCSDRKSFNVHLIFCNIMHFYTIYQGFLYNCLIFYFVSFCRGWNLTPTCGCKYSLMSSVPTCCRVIKCSMCNIVAWKIYSFTFPKVVQLRPDDGLKYKLKHVA